MAWTAIYVLTLAEFTQKAGANASATAIAEGFGLSFCLQAEAIINMLCRKVFAVDVAAFAALPATTRYLLTDATTNLAAIYAIQYDFSAFTSRSEAESMITVLRDGFLRDLSLLRDKKNQAFLMTGVEN